MISQFLEIIIGPTCKPSNNYDAQIIYKGSGRSPDQAILHISSKKDDKTVFFKLNEPIKKCLIPIKSIERVKKKVKRIMLLIRIIRNHQQMILIYRIRYFWINMMKLYCHKNVYYHLMLLKNMLQVRLIQLIQLIIIAINIPILLQTTQRLIKR